MNVGIVGCGIFGIAAAIELRERGHAVTAFDQGRVPFARASSTDVKSATKSASARVARSEVIIVRAPNDPRTRRTSTAYAA